MATRRSQDWIDAFFNSCEVAAAAIADKQKFQKGAGRNMPMAFDMEAYRHRSEVWRRVRKELITFGFDVEEVDFRGLEPNPSDPSRLRFNSKKGVVELFHSSESQHPIIFQGDDAVVVKHFLEFYLSAYHQGTDPREYTKKLLIHQGITRDNFAQHKDKLLINNPWEE